MRLRILMIPARGNTGPNAYTGLMTDELERLGHTVDDITVTRAAFAERPPGRLRALATAVRCLLPRYDIIHIHWPHTFAQEHSYLVAMLRGSLFPAMLWWQRILGARVVWTVHDAQPMTRRHRVLTTAMMRLVVPAVDGFVFLSRSSRAALRQAYPAGARKPSVLTYHASYGDVHRRPARPSLRAQLGIDPDRPVIGFLGDIKEYKGIDTLLDACEQPIDGAPAILVAGAAVPPICDQRIDQRIEALRRAGVQIQRTHWSRMSDAELDSMIAACDLVVLPYRTGWNSGIATLVLEHSRPVLCSDLPAFRELHDELSDRWVTLFRPPLTAEVLAQAARRAARAHYTDPLIPVEFFKRRGWPMIIEQIVDLYKSVRTAR